MNTKLIWELVKPDADETDSIFLTGLGCDVEVVMPEWQEFTSASGTRARYLAENPYIKITTTCKKQEIMLQLKYGDRLNLLEEHHVYKSTFR